MSPNIPDITSDTAAAGGTSAAGVDMPDQRIFVFALFFIFAGITSLNDVIIPKLKGLFTLSYAQAMLVRSAFFAAYFVMSLPGAAIVRRVGYMRAAVVGLLTMTAGCLLFIPASSSSMFPLFLGALFVLAAGVTIVQVVANPLVSMLGVPATAHSRLTFAQAFNSLGTTIFPYAGAILILGTLATVDPATLGGAALDAFRAQETRVIVRTYIGLALALAGLAALVWLRRKRLVESPAAATSILHAFDLLGRPRFAFGALCIFLYVGASAQAAGKHVPIYWGGAMADALGLRLALAIRAACYAAILCFGLRAGRLLHTRAGAQGN
jgi:FHS family L-fucose permease-like MFS transporter